ncbi:MAG: phosphatase PAP2 family protein [Acutalibacteraceae bacterium]
MTALFDSFLNFDLSVFEWIQSIQTPILNAIMKVITTMGDEGIIFIAMALVLVFTKKYRKAGFTMLAALGIMLVCNNLVLKEIFERTRPFNLFAEDSVKYALWGGENAKYVFPNIVEQPHSFSFPSGHTSSAFAAAIAVLWYDRKIGIPTTIFAFLMGFSRIYVEVHYCTDVIAGAIVGTIYALLAVLIAKYLYPVFEKLLDKVLAKVKKKA